MTKEEALKIIDLFKVGKKHKTGHYQHRYIYYFFSDGFIIEKKEDLGLNYFEPDITITKICVDEFIARLIKEHEYENFIRNII